MPWTVVIGDRLDTCRTAPQHSLQQRLRYECYRRRLQTWYCQLQTVQRRLGKWKIVFQCASLCLPKWYTWQSVTRLRLFGATDCFVALCFWIANCMGATLSLRCFSLPVRGQCSKIWINMDQHCSFYTVGSFCNAAMLLLLVLFHPLLLPKLLLSLPIILIVVLVVASSAYCSFLLRVLWAELCSVCFLISAKWRKQNWNIFNSLIWSVEICWNVSCAGLRLRPVWQVLWGSACSWRSQGDWKERADEELRSGRFADPNVLGQEPVGRHSNGARIECSRKHHEQIWEDRTVWNRLGSNSAAWRHCYIWLTYIIYTYVHIYIYICIT